MRQIHALSRFLIQLFVSHGADNTDNCVPGFVIFWWPKPNAFAYRILIWPVLAHQSFIERATVGFDEYAASVEPWTLERGEMETGVPAETIRDFAHAYAKA